MISKNTATDIALAYREMERAQELMDEIEKRRSRYEAPDIRDAFGRPSAGLQLGIPSSDSSRTLHNVPWELCRPVLEVHIAHHRQRIAILSEKARLELSRTADAAAEPTE